MDYGMWNERTNMSMLTDFYELTMANGYLDNGCGDTIVYFDAFFRNVPEGGGYAVMAGVEQVIDYLSNLHFSERDLEFLQNNYHFGDKFIEYLRNFEFTCVNCIISATSADEISRFPLLYAILLNQVLNLPGIQWTVRSLKCQNEILSLVVPVAPVRGNLTNRFPRVFLIVHLPEMLPYHFISQPQIQDQKIRVDCSPTL